MIDETEFDAEMNSAKLEYTRAMNALRACRNSGSGNTYFQEKRVNAARSAIEMLKGSPVYLARLEKRSEEKRQIKRAGSKRFREKHGDVLRAKQKETARKYRQSGKAKEYRSRPDVSERLRKYKEMKRREAGAVPRDGNKKAKAAEQKRLEKAAFIENFTGPPTPSKSLSDAEYYLWRIKNNPDFYAKELDRAQRYKARTRAGYKDSLVKWAEVPQAMKEVKHLQYLISRQLKGTEHENHQRAA